MQKVVTYILIGILFVSTLFFAGTTIYSGYKLRVCVRELESVRTELAAATDKQQELRDILRDSDAILSSSISTVSELRNAIRVIEANYKKMENVLRNNGSSDSANDSGAGDSVS